MLAQNPALALRSTVVRIHANVLGEEAERGHPGEALLRRLLERARQQLGPARPRRAARGQASHGLVFVDEVDKIRSHVGGQVNVAGIRAQEALLTLIENEAVPFALPDWAGGGTVNVDSSGLLFVCAGAFEGLYDAVFHRVTAGRDKGALKPVTVVENGRVREELPFVLRDWLKDEDLFDTASARSSSRASTPSCCSTTWARRSCCASSRRARSRACKQTQAYFAALGFRFELTEAAARRIAKEAARQPRLGARALKEIFRRVIGPFEFDPRRPRRGRRAPAHRRGRGREGASRPGRVRSDSAASVAGWDASFPMPDTPGA